ncbi:hypothetical protein [Nocardia otitidiscaviarum]|uniref:hypothetical protein n=1 Tax=Nocardia otitidiscaviarum TaxID=1823 RepID=UPI00069446F7|nr:hypothetical protein [Nocardia otitidiscaviarum]
MLVVLVCTGIGMYFVNGEQPDQAQISPPRPTRDAQVFDLYGKNLAEAERYLGITDGTNVAGTTATVVPIPVASAIDGLPPDRLTVTAACVAPEDGPTGNTLRRVNIAVTPTSDLTDQIRQRIRDRDYTGELASTAGCAWTGGALTVYTD